MTRAQERRNRERLEEALGKHGTAVFGTTTLPVITGQLLYGFLDAAFGKLRPADCDTGRKNAVRWLRRHAKQAAGTTEK